MSDAVCKSRQAKAEAKQDFATKTMKKDLQTFKNVICALKLKVT